jgi:hypothetical protein
MDTAGFREIVSPGGLRSSSWLCEWPRQGEHGRIIFAHRTNQLVNGDSVQGLSHQGDPDGGPNV